VVSFTAGRDWNWEQSGELYCWKRLKLGTKQVAFVDQLSDCQLLSKFSVTCCLAGDVQFCS